MSLDFKLNLGPFNRCVEYLPIGSKAEYSIDNNSAVLCQNCHVNSSYPSNSPTQLFELAGRETFTATTFDVGSSSDNEDDNKSWAEIIEFIEVHVLLMVSKMIDSLSYKPNFNDIKIPVRATHIYRDDVNGGQYGWAEVGIAIFGNIDKLCAS